MVYCIMMIKIKKIYLEKDECVEKDKYGEKEHYNLKVETEDWRIFKTNSYYWEAWMLAKITFEEEKE